MESIIISPKDQAELELLMQLLNRMNVANKVLSVEDHEDLGLAVLMQEADRTKKVSKETILKTLSQK